MAVCALLGRADENEWISARAGIRFIGFWAMRLSRCRHIRILLLPRSGVQEAVMVPSGPVSLGSLETLRGAVVWVK